MRQSIAAFALIVRGEQDEEPQLLAQWNDNWKAFNFVGGHKEDGETHLQCACRELEEELHLKKGEYEQPQEKCGALSFEDISGRTGQKTNYQFEVFRFKLTDAALTKVNADPRNKWLTYAEVGTRKTADKRVSKTMGTILQELVGKKVLPMRKSPASFALITREHNGVLQLLARWNANWQGFNFVGGKKSKGETFSQTICRKLNLEPADASVGPTDQPGSEVKLEDDSDSIQIKTHYMFEVVPFRINETGLRRVNADSDNAWLTFAEIVNGRAADDRKVSRTMQKVLRHVVTTSSSLTQWRLPFQIYTDKRLEKKHLWIRTCNQGEVIAQAGDFSEWATFLLKGKVSVFTTRPPIIEDAPLRRLDQSGFNEYGNDVPALRGRVGSAPNADWTIEASQSPHDRLMGITSTLWNQPRSVTLVAAVDCELLWIKRSVLLDVVKSEKSYLPWNMERFWEKLPRLLKTNQLIAGDTTAAAALTEAMKDSVIFCHRYDRQGRSKQIIEREPRPNLKAKEGKDLVIFNEEETTDTTTTGIYFILHGAVRLTRKTPGGKVLVHQYADGGFFEHASLDAYNPCSFTAEAVADTTLFQLSPAGVQKMIARVPIVEERVRAKRAIQQDRLRQVMAGDHVPPDGMTVDMATKLLLARDVLAIDMDLCSRCDECVVGCVHAHDGVARFQRANPKLAFERWEVARACVHCTDAPCQAACDETKTGAITFLPSGLVHIHQDRCTGCKKCVPACPFDVIVMHDLADSLQDDIKKQERLERNSEAVVATKCDRCMTFDKEPMCVTSCPYDALQRKKPEKLFPKLKVWAEGEAVK